MSSLRARKQKMKKKAVDKQIDTQRACKQKIKKAVDKQIDTQRACKQKMKKKSR